MEAIVLTERSFEAVGDVMSMNTKLQPIQINVQTRLLTPVGLSHSEMESNPSPAKPCYSNEQATTDWLWIPTHIRFKQ